MAQRLIRVCCPECGAEHTVTTTDLLKLPEALRGSVVAGHRLIRACGCNVCRHTGYTGRRLACELMLNTPEFSELIVRGASPAQRAVQAGADGWRPLARHALDLALTGDTTLEEVCELV